MDKVWPHFNVEPQYPDAVEGWEDPKLPNFERIWEVARDCGYSVGLHGSMKRDVDLIAVPWTDTASSAEFLIDSLCTALNARRVNLLEDKPHGRMALTLLIDGWYKPIDLSIVPFIKA